MPGQCRTSMVRRGWSRCFHIQPPARCSRTPGRPPAPAPSRAVEAWWGARVRPLPHLRPDCLLLSLPLAPFRVRVVTDPAGVWRTLFRARRTAVESSPSSAVRLPRTPLLKWGRQPPVDSDRRSLPCSVSVIGLGPQELFLTQRRWAASSPHMIADASDWKQPGRLFACAGEVCTARREALPPRAYRTAKP